MNENCIDSFNKEAWISEWKDSILKTINHLMIALNKLDDDITKEITIDIYESLTRLGCLGSEFFHSNIFINYIENSHDR